MHGAVSSGFYPTLSDFRARFRFISVHVSDVVLVLRIQPLKTTTQLRPPSRQNLHGLFFRGTRLTQGQTARASPLSCPRRLRPTSGKNGTANVRCKPERAIRRSAAQPLESANAFAHPYEAPLGSATCRDDLNDLGRHRRACQALSANRQRNQNARQAVRPSHRSSHHRTSFSIKQR